MACSKASESSAIPSPLIEHDHYDLAEMKEISSMTCLILPAERWQTLLPEQLVSSIKSVAKHRKIERWNVQPEPRPPSTRCSTLAAREKCGPETRPGSFLGWAKVVFRQFPFPVWNSLVTPHFQNAKSLDYGNPMVLDQLRDAIASCLLIARGAPR